MPTLLALETATNICDVALFTNGILSARRTLTEPRSHAEHLVPMIDACLKEGGTAVHELDAISVSAGPGSYTGLRIGASVAKGLAFASEVPIIAVPTLEALAEPVLCSSSDPVISTMISRRSEIYLGVFQRSNENTRRLVPETTVALDSVASSLRDAGILQGSICGPGVDRLREHNFNFASFDTVNAELSAESVGIVSLRRFESELFEDTSSFEPYYLRDFEARKGKTSIFDRLPF